MESKTRYGAPTMPPPARTSGWAAASRRVRQYLEAQLIDEMHLAVHPVLLGRGESLLAGLDLPALGYAVAKVAAGERATHVVIRKAALCGQEDT